MEDVSAKSESSISPWVWWAAGTAATAAAVAYFVWPNPLRISNSKFHKYAGDRHGWLRRAHGKGVVWLPGTTSRLEGEFRDGHICGSGRWLDKDAGGKEVAVGTRAALLMHNSLTMREISPFALLSAVCWPL